MIKKTTSRLLILGISIFLGVELLVRLLGLTDFPLYDANNSIGYILKPSQSGEFLNKNAWQFNALSMQNDEEFLPDHNKVNTLLIGDSIVSGGNPLSKKDRLGFQLAKVLNQPVWSISSGSWALRNELTYLMLHPDVVKGVDHIIFILNSGNFGKASSWACEFSHPRTYPLIASFYLFKRYIYIGREALVILSRQKN